MEAGKVGTVTQFMKKEKEKMEVNQSKNKDKQVLSQMWMICLRSQKLLAVTSFFKKIESKTPYDSSFLAFLLSAI